MTLRSTSWLLHGLLSAALLVGCNGTSSGGDGSPGTDGSGAHDGTSDAASGPCGVDTDMDGIPDQFEGTGDFDMDGIPNYRDTDSDNDGRPDGLEANQGHPYDCHVSPVDSDHDGMPDFIDLDSDNNTIPDSQDFVGQGMTPSQGWAIEPSDFDHDGVPDYCDLDDDGDTIDDSVEIAPGNAGAPTDTDGDGVPDYHDLDSDADTISDRDDGNRDDDGDGIPDFRDTDSDNDTILDSVEAGDAMLTTPPVECPRELNAMTLMGYMNDGLQDFRDIDSDNDGLSDHDEITYGTDPCNPDTNGNGTLDSVDVVWCNQHHQTGCASQTGFTIPTTDYYLILPNNGPQVQRELEFGTNIRVADVFFIFDTTGSMSAVQQQVAQTIATPTTGMVDQIRGVIPNTYFGVGHHDDFPTGGYGSPGFGGSAGDRAIHPLCAGPVGSGTDSWCQSGQYGGIIEQSPDHGMDVQTGALAIPGGSGDDTPESQTVALYEIPTNDGLYDHSNPAACSGEVGSAPCWIRPTQCPEGTWGYPCFRDGSLAISVLFTDSPFHNGSRDLSPPTTTYYEPYMGISPTPPNFDDMVQAYLRHGARQIMVNCNLSERCVGQVYTNHNGGSFFGGGPCFDMRMALEGTGSVDVDGVDLVYDLPTTGGVSSDFVGDVTSGVQELATRVPQDINTRTRNDPANPDMVDASLFIKRRVPSCQIPPINTNCWTEPMNVTHAQAVARTDLSTFYRVVPGTRVRFTIFFQNDGVYPGSYTSVSLFHAFIDVLGDGASLLDTRDVFILVPVRQPDLG